MMDELVRGTLRDASDAPPTGETTYTIAHIDGVAIEQILSGTLDAPVAYRAAVAEWVVVLAGHAELDVDGADVALAAGDWLLLPAGTPHRLTYTEPGTSWLTVTGQEP